MNPFISNNSNYITKNNITSPQANSMLDFNGKIQDKYLPDLYLSTLDDIQLQDIQNNQALIYDLGEQIWKNGTVPFNLEQLTDVSVTNATNNNVLQYENGYWVNSNLSISESNVTNLVSDLASCEKTANKNQPSGYAGLDTNVNYCI